MWLSQQVMDYLKKKVLHTNMVDLDKLYCTKEDGSVVSFSEMVLSMFADCVESGGAKQEMDVTDNSGELRKQASEKQTFTVRMANSGNGGIYYLPASVLSSSGVIAQISCSTIFNLPGIAMFDFALHFQFSTNSENVGLTVKATKLT